MARKIAIILGVLFACFWAGILVLARCDALAAVSSNSGAIVKFESVFPSKAHGFYIVFKVEQNSEVSRAYWRFMPFRRVEVEK